MLLRVNLFYIIYKKSNSVELLFVTQIFIVVNSNNKTIFVAFIFIKKLKT